MGKIALEAAKGTPNNEDKPQAVEFGIITQISK